MSDCQQQLFEVYRATTDQWQRVRAYRALHSEAEEATTYLSNDHWAESFEKVEGFETDRSGVPDQPDVGVTGGTADGRLDANF